MVTEVGLSRCELGLKDSGQGPLAGRCQHDNEPSGYVKFRDLLGQLRDYHLLKQASSPLS
jgi:hypothetical protein